MDIAIAYEVSKSGFFLLPSFNNFGLLNNNIKFYSNFGPFRAANLIISGNQDCSEVISGSYIIVVYNSFQHAKRAFASRKITLGDNISKDNINSKNRFNFSFCIKV